MRLPNTGIAAAVAAFTLASCSNMTGEWVGWCDADGTLVGVVMPLEGALDGGVSGTIEARLWEEDYDGVVEGSTSGNGVELTIDLPDVDGYGITVEFSGEVDGGGMVGDGEMSIEGMDGTYDGDCELAKRRE